MYEKVEKKWKSYLYLDTSTTQLNEWKCISGQMVMMHIILIEMCHMEDVYLDGCHKSEREKTT